MTFDRYVSLGLPFALTLRLSGCSAPTEVDRDNRRLLDAILTAITMKNTNWLEDDAELASVACRWAAARLKAASAESST